MRWMLLINIYFFDALFSNNAMRVSNTLMYSFMNKRW